MPLAGVKWSIITLSSMCHIYSPSWSAWAKQSGRGGYPRSCLSLWRQDVHSEEPHPYDISLCNKLTAANVPGSKMRTNVSLQTQVKWPAAEAFEASYNTTPILLSLAASRGQFTWPSTITPEPPERPFRNLLSKAILKHSQEELTAKSIDRKKTHTYVHTHTLSLHSNCCL